MLERLSQQSAAELICASGDLVIGFGVALYAGWILGLLAKNLAVLSEAEVARVTTSLVFFAIGRAVMVAGLKVLHSHRFNRWLSTMLGDEREKVMVSALIDRIYCIAIFFMTFAAIMVAMGVSATAVGAVLGGAGIGIGFGTQQISQNFLSGLMLFFNRPFAEGDWINVSTFAGTVERIGWYHTRIRTFDRRPLFIPNSLFATTPIENPGRMYNRRIKVEIGLRYEDLGRIELITDQVRAMLKEHPAIDQQQSVMANFDQWGDSSIGFLVYCFTKSTVWAEWLAAQQDVFLKIAGIVQAAGADFAFPSATVYPSTSFNPQHPLFAQGQQAASQQEI